MEIVLGKSAVRQIRLSAQDAIEEGDTETLREDILEAFTEEQVEEIERRLDNGDFYEFLTEMLDEWSGDDVDELFELLRQIARGQIDFRAVGAAARKRAVRDHTWTTRLRAALSALGGTADQKCE